LQNLYKKEKGVDAQQDATPKGKNFKDWCFNLVKTDLLTYWSPSTLK
jgi:hypothetical protein